MKILKDTTTELIIQYLPWQVWVIVGLFITMGGLNLLMLGIVVLVSEGSYIFLAMALWFLFVPLLIFCLAGQIFTYNFDKNTRELTVTKSLLMFSKTEKYPLQSIVSVCRRIVIKKGTYYVIFLVLSPGRFYELFFYFRNEQESEKNAQKIANFLGVPNFPVVNDLELNFWRITKLFWGGYQRREEAIAELSYEISKNPGDVYAYCYLIRLLQMQKRKAEAKMTLENAKLTLQQRGEFIKGAQLNWYFQERFLTKKLFS